MNLATIAETLRKSALAQPGDQFTKPLFHGASVNLSARIVSTTETAQEVEWNLSILRPGRLPLEATKEYAAWLRELQTFRSEKYFNVPASVSAKMMQNKGHYAAEFVWTAVVELSSETPSEDEYFEEPPVRVPKQQVGEIKMSPLPTTPAEMEAWAKTLGPGVHIRHVNVFTGEVSS